jgi:hypothetical protein
LPRVENTFSGMKKSAKLGVVYMLVRFAFTEDKRLL